VARSFDFSAAQNTRGSRNLSTPILYRESMHHEPESSLVDAVLALSVAVHDVLVEGS
jgi:hypothetical protein